MGRIGIIVAMVAELKLVEGLLVEKEEKVNNGFHFIQGKVGNEEVIAMQCGIGKVCAAVGTVEMIRCYAPDCIINTGVAGGIDGKLQVMDIVIGREVVYHDVWCGEGNEKGQVQGMPAFFRADERLLEKVRLVKSRVVLYEGLVCTGDQFITNRTALEKIKQDFPEGLAVDMESGAIAQVCYMNQLPFLSFRVISDTPGETDDHRLQYQNFWKMAPEKSFEVLKQVLNKMCYGKNTEL